MNNYNDFRYIDVLGSFIVITAFWDKEDKADALVLATLGFVKKDRAIPRKEIDKAKRIRQEYFEIKSGR